MVIWKHLLGLCALGLATSAGAVERVRPTQILNEKNVDYLCSKGNPRVIDKFRFASHIVAEQKIPFDLMVLARADGEMSTSYGREEIMHYVSSDAPFGANPRPEYAARIKEATLQRLRFMGDLQIWFLEAANDPKRTYTPTSATGGIPRVEDYFRENGGVEIVCRAKAQDVPPPSMPSADQTSKKLYENILVRKTVAQLAIPRDKLKKADGAQFSYADDRVKDSETFSIDGVLGYRIIGTSVDRADKLAGRVAGTSADLESSYWFNVTPYIYQKKVTTRPTSKSSPDQDVLQPGAALNLTWVSPTGIFAFDVQAEGSHIIDNAQNSEVTTASVRFAPSLLGPGGLVIFQAPIHFDFFTLRPDLAFIARAYVVDEPGLNKQLKDKASFASTGGEASLRTTFPSSLPVLADLQLKLGYLYLVNSDGVADINRWTTGLSYAFPGVENLTFDVDYVDGRDERTLVLERRWTAALAFRY